MNLPALLITCELPETSRRSSTRDDEAKSVFMTDQKRNTERVKDQSQTRAKPRHPRDATHGLQCERILKMEVEGRLVETIVIKPDGVASPAQKLKPMKTTHFPR